MTAFQAAILALIQGITEFLPISSSAHLILAPVLFGWDDQGLAFDVAVHVGTLAAVMLYFRRDVLDLTVAGIRDPLTRDWTSSGRLAWAVVLGTIPAGLVGLLAGDLIETYLRSPLVIATTTIVFGLALWWADTRRGTRTADDITWRDALWIGLAQAVALIPGTSRSGITMTAGLALGLNREACARFSFLLSIPVILLAGGLKLLDLLGAGVAVDWVALGIGIVVSAASAFACIALFMGAISRMGFLPFVIYRLLLGGFLFVLFWP